MPHSVLVVGSCVKELLSTAVAKDCVVTAYREPRGPTWDEVIADWVKDIIRQCALYDAIEGKTPAVPHYRQVMRGKKSRTFGGAMRPREHPRPRKG